jgi:hypothetical protein
VAHTESAVAPVKSSTICDYVAPRFRENATPESIISTICAPHSGRNCRRSAKEMSSPLAAETLLRQNKPKGFMCVSCSWAKPPDYHTF